MRGFNSYGAVRRGQLGRRVRIGRRKFSRAPGVFAAGELIQGLKCESPLGEVRAHLRRVFGRALFDVFRIIDGRDEAQYYLLSYLSRTLLETSAAATLSRLDPFRIMALRKAQLDGQYEYDRRSMLAIEWGRDVITKDGSDTPQWTSLKGPEAYSKALLDAPWLSLALKDAISKSSDAVREQHGSWFRELREKEPEILWRFTRGQCSQLYSRLSKHVHVEFMSDLAEFDQAGIIDNSLRSVKIAILIAYISHFIDHSSGCLSAEAAVTCMKNAQAALSEVTVGRV